MIRGCGLDSGSYEWVPVVGFCEHGNEYSDSMKGSELVNYLSDCQLLKNFIL
jgi:hypothetical protein